MFLPAIRARVVKLPEELLRIVVQQSILRADGLMRRNLVLIEHLLPRDHRRLKSVWIKHLDDDLGRLHVKLLLSLIHI